MKLLTLPTLILILCSLDVSAQPEAAGPVPALGTVAAPGAERKPSTPNPAQNASRTQRPEEKAAAKPPSL